MSRNFNNVWLFKCFSFIVCAFGILSKKSSPNPRKPKFSCYLVWVLSLWCCCERCNICIEIQFFACGCPVFPAPLVANTILSPLNCLFSSDRYQLTIFVWLYFCVLLFNQSFLVTANLTHLKTSLDLYFKKVLISLCFFGLLWTLILIKWFVLFFLVNYKKVHSILR